MTRTNFLNYDGGPFCLKYEIPGTSGKCCSVCKSARGFPKSKTLSEGNVAEPNEGATSTFLTNEIKQINLLTIYNKRV